MSDSRKRREDRSFDMPPYSKRKFDYSNVEGTRFLIPSKAGGCMIGKGGEVIKRLRSEFKCRLMVPDSKGPERMMIIDAGIETIINIWNEVLPLIKDSLNAKECDFKNSDSRHIEGDDELDIRLVVHESQAGAVIGKGGERIRNLIDTHKMSIIKLCPKLCPNSTDRIVRLVANQESVLDCVRSILKVLENQAIKGSRCDYDPDNYDESAAPNYGGYISKEPHFAPRSAPARPSMGGHRSNDDYVSASSLSYDRENSKRVSNSLSYLGSNSHIPHGVSDLLSGILRITSNGAESEKRIERVALPIFLVSAVIGSDGHRLHDIQRDSGAHIQLNDEPYSDREELFVVRGNSDQIYKAKCLMQLCARKYGYMDLR